MKKIREHITYKSILVVVVLLLVFAIAVLLHMSFRA